LVSDFYVPYVPYVAKFRTVFFCDFCAFLRLKIQDLGLF